MNLLSLWFESQPSHPVYVEAFAEILEVRMVLHKAAGWLLQNEGDVQGCQHQAYDHAPAHHSIPRLS